MRGWRPRVPPTAVLGQASPLAPGRPGIQRGQDSPSLVRTKRPGAAGVVAPPRERRAGPGVFEAQSRPPPWQDHATSARASPAAREPVQRRRVSGGAAGTGAHTRLLQGQGAGRCSVRGSLCRLCGSRRRGLGFPGEPRVLGPGSLASSPQERSLRLGES